MEYKLKREQVKSLRDVAYEAMKEAILSGDIAPGEKLTETDLSNQLSISRGPIREALRQLERGGGVPHGGGRSGLHAHPPHDRELRLLSGRNLV
ncbi:MAG: GntR family transcriptional regulator [Oscillibacter sp.]|nr:GntR family transcriptional regulator [Oscillibacter sp.]